MPKYSDTYRKIYREDYGTEPPGYKEQTKAKAPTFRTALEKSAYQVGEQKFAEPSLENKLYPGSISASADTLALRKAGLPGFGELPEERKMDLTGAVNRLQAGTASRADSLKVEKDLPGYFGKPYGPEAIAKAEEDRLKKTEKGKTTAKSARTEYNSALKGKNAAITYLASVKGGASPAEASSASGSDSGVEGLLRKLVLGGKKEWGKGDIDRIEDSIGKLVGSYDEVITGYENKRLESDIASFGEQYPASEYDGQTATDSKTGLKLMSQNGKWVILDQIEGR